MMGLAPAIVKTKTIINHSGQLLVRPEKSTGTSTTTAAVSATPATSGTGGSAGGGLNSELSKGCWWEGLVAFCHPKLREVQGTLLPMIPLLLSLIQLYWRSLSYYFKHLNRMLRPLLPLLLVVASTAALSSSLPPLLQRTFKGKAAGVIEVTVGEQFSLPLPQFDSPWNSHNFWAFPLSALQFQQHFTPEQSNEDTQQGEHQEPMSMDYLPLKCSLVEGSSSVLQDIASLPEEYSRVSSTRWQQNSYVLLASKSLLYLLNAAASELTAYIYSEHSLEKITTYKLHQFIYREEQIGQLTVSPPALALSAAENRLFIFSSLGIWAVETKTILSNVKKVGTLSGFDSAKVGGLDKILHGESGVLVGLKRMDRVFIIPEPSPNQEADYTFTELTHFKEARLFPQDVAIVSNILYVLDFYKGVYVFELLKHNQAVPLFSVSISAFGGNYQFRVYSSTIFVNFNDVDGSKVAQIALDLESASYNLVRFYKSDEFINSMKVFTLPTQYYLQPLRERYSEQTFESFLFLLQNGQDLEIYPFNLDPRIITKAYNAVKFKGNQIKEFFHLEKDRFLIITNEQIRYLRVRVARPSVTCLAESSESNYPENYFRLQLTSNTSTCEHQDHSQPIKQHSNEYCQMTMDYYLRIGDPDASQHQKAMLYGLVVLVVACFIGGLLCLMQWRNNKMLILDRLRTEIVNFRNRHKKIQPFVEENYQHKDIEIEVPKIEAVLQEGSE